jgi:hypothetical protein
MSTRTLAGGLEARGDESTEGFDPDGGGVRQALIMDKLGKAARTVTALLDFATVGIENPVAEIRVGPEWTPRQSGSGRSRSRSDGQPASDKARAWVGTVDAARQ